MNDEVTEQFLKNAGLQIGVSSSHVAEGLGHQGATVVFIQGIEARKMARR